MRPLEGRNALVTGAGRGIGRATAMALAELGAGVAVLARSSEQVESVAGEIRAGGGRALALSVDVADYAAVRTAMDEIAGRLGLVSVLINNAGVMPIGPLVTSDPAAWREAVEINLVGPYNTMRLLLPEMVKAGWGRVVNVSSGAAVLPSMRNRSAYASSKAGLDRLTLMTAGELAGSGVTLNVVYPGLTDTAMPASIRQASSDLISPEVRDRFRERYERGEYHRPEEVARLIGALVLSDCHAEIINMDQDRGKELLATWPG